MLIWGISSETEALVCVYFLREAKPQLLISFVGEVGPQHIWKLSHGTGYKKGLWGVCVSREGKIFGVITDFMFTWHPCRALTGWSSASKYCTSSNKTLFPAVQMKKSSLGDVEPTTLL